MYENEGMDARAGLDYAKAGPVQPISSYAADSLPARASEVILLEEALERNAYAISNLAERLDPVMQPDWAEGNNPSEKAIVSRFAELRMRLESQTARLNRLVERLEI